MNIDVLYDISAERFNTFNTAFVFINKIKGMFCQTPKYCDCDVHLEYEDKDGAASRSLTWWV
jgi:hypothetical protein